MSCKKGMYTHILAVLRKSTLLEALLICKSLKEADLARDASNAGG